MPICHHARLLHQKVCYGGQPPQSQCFVYLLRYLLSRIALSVSFQMCHKMFQCQGTPAVEPSHPLKHPSPIARDGYHHTHYSAMDPDSNFDSSDDLRSPDQGTPPLPPLGYLWYRPQHQNRPLVASSPFGSSDSPRRKFLAISSVYTRTDFDPK